MNDTLPYHEDSKHHPERYAPGPGGLDWATQPDPFRRFAGAARIDLPLLSGELPVAWDDLFRPGAVPARTMTRESLGHLLQLTLGLAAWKSWGSTRWALRCNPSSGNLHPTEGYLACPALPGLAAGVYHYQPHDHCLEQRTAAPFAWTGGVLLAFNGIHWREAWKYGLRAFRYCQHDCGHALAALSYAAAALGWPVRLLGDWGDAQLAALTGSGRAEDFAGAERETAEAIAWVGPGEPPAPQAVLDLLATAAWRGRANTLSPARLPWPGIERVAEASRRPAAPAQQAAGSRQPADLPPLPPLPPGSAEPASRLIRRRRSAQAYDGRSILPAAAFWRLLDALLPRPGLPPWSLLATPPRVHPVLFVHRVAGLAPGIYCLPRDAAQGAALRAAMRPDWLWQRVAAAPAHLPLFLLAPMDVQAFAAGVSCQQDIAADCAFAVAMLARFDDFADRPWRYRERFLEAGILGQALYLEAEAAGCQGTGIGCYFDDAVHRALGLAPDRYQDVYHFSLGTAVVDRRLANEPAYAHLDGR